VPAANSFSATDSTTSPTSTPDPGQPLSSYVSLRRRTWAAALAHGAGQPRLTPDRPGFPNSVVPDVTNPAACSATAGTSKRLEGLLGCRHLRDDPRRRHALPREPQRTLRLMRHPDLYRAGDDPNFTTKPSSRDPSDRISLPDRDRSPGHHGASSSKRQRTITASRSSRPPLLALVRHPRIPDT